MNPVLEPYKDRPYKTGRTFGDLARESGLVESGDQAPGDVRALAWGVPSEAPPADEPANDES